MEQTSILRKKRKRQNTDLSPSVRDLKLLMEPKTITKEITMLTFYPPRECGIATYSQDMESALARIFNDSFKLKICPLENSGEPQSYTGPVEPAIVTAAPLDYLKASETINRNKNCELVLIQHEFGLFRCNESAFYDFLESLDKPLLFTFHTVLPEPDLILCQKIRRLASLAKGIVVMTRTSAQILDKDYDIDRNLITVILHGTHLIVHQNKAKLKKKYALEPKTVLSTFGLLGPGKNIETTLKALPAIVKEHPNIMFLILGKTHPTLLRKYGEDYRQFLQYTSERLGISKHVRFIDTFLPLYQLLEYLQLTDIYLFTSKDPNQAVSGTFAYALSYGCPVISTPIPHALEVLQNEAGILFDFEDSIHLRQAILELLDDSGQRQTMSLNGMQDIASSSWENVAIAHGRLFKKLTDGKVNLKYNIPDINLDHLKRMTTQTGIIQFSKGNRPDSTSGYTLDDNARALVATCMYYSRYRDDSVLLYINIYFNFIKNCFRADGNFLNCLDEHRNFTAENYRINLEDANGRALWGLGYFISIAHELPDSFEGVLRCAKYIFEEVVFQVKNYGSPRAMAFIIKGIYYLNIDRHQPEYIELLQLFATRLKSMFEANSDVEWKWFEPYLTYGNAIIPQGLCMVYHLTKDATYKQVAYESFDFLLSKTFKNEKIKVITHTRWLHQGDEIPEEFQGGEQPIDVAYTILALRTFNKTFPDAGYDGKMRLAFNWFLGCNAQNKIVYNPCTGGCHDGLETYVVNLNQGAESTLSYLLARLTVENVT